MIELITRLLLAHIVGDFFLQPDGICKAKKERTVKGFLTCGGHSLIQAVLAYIAVADWRCWWIPLVVFLSHWLIDTCKNRFGSDSLTSFSVDQLLHIAVIGIIAYSYKSSPGLPEISEPMMLYLLSYLIILMPISIFIREFTKQWAPPMDHTASLPNAGKYIGYLERVMILTFIYAGHVEGIGFLLAAKSIFRFGDLNKPKEVCTTEYVLLGTFSSFTISILIGFGVILLLKRI